MVSTVRAGALLAWLFLVAGGPAVSPAMGQDRADLIVQAEKYARMAEGEEDLEKAKGCMDEAVKLLRKFVAENPKGSAAMEQQSIIGCLIEGKARRVAAASVEEDDPALKTALRREARDLYVEAEKHFETVGDALAKAPEQTNDTAYFTMLARLDRPRMMVERAGVEDGGGRVELLRAAVKLLDEFQWDWAGYYNVFEAMLLQGRCFTELAEFAQAETKLKGAIGIGARLAKDGRKPEDYHRQVIFQSFVALARTYIRSGRPAEVGKLAAQVVRENAMGAQEESRKLAAELEKLAANPDPPRNDATAEQAARAADSDIRRRRFADAVKHLRRCIDACSTEAEREKYEPEATFRMGECLKALGRVYEAASMYEAVCVKFPAHELAPVSCFEAAQCYGSELALSGDPRDREARKKYFTLLITVHKDHPVALNVPYLLAEDEEAEGNFRRAAELYLEVKEAAQSYEPALVRAGCCLRRDAEAQWKEWKKDNAKAEALAAAKKAFGQAEEVLLKFVGRLETQPKDADQARRRSNAALFAYEQLACVSMHEAVGKTKECIEFLRKCAKGLRPGDERAAKIWALEVQAHLKLDDVASAVPVVDAMIAKYPDDPSIADACRRTGFRLLEAAKALTGAERAAAGDRWRKVGRYLQKWLDLAGRRGRIEVNDVLSVAGGLSLVARELNGLGDDVRSFADLGGRPIVDAKSFEDAAYVYELLAASALSEGQRIAVLQELARFKSFAAADESGWERARDAYQRICDEFKLLDASKQLDVLAVQRHPELLRSYLEMGSVYRELGRHQTFQFGNALRVLAETMEAADRGTGLWWEAKYTYFATLVDRGAAGDLDNARVGLRNLEKNWPDFDGGPWKDRFQELKKQVEGITGGR